MLLKYFYDKALAQASYMVGCAATGEALIIDPLRNIAPYLQAAKDEGLQITHITETHIHADFVSGARELVAQTGGRLYLSDMGDADWKYAYADENTVLLRDGDMWMVGNIRVEVLHTPGHTPEHIAFMITDTAAADQPIGVFTGDFLFVGDVGRPDLLEEAAGILNTKEPGARKQFATVQHFKQLPDYLQIWPGHGAGSACGKALGAIPSTTLGYEKLFNPAFQFEDEQAFVDWLLDGQPEAPRYFAQMKKVNKLGPALLADLTPPKQLNADELTQAAQAGYLVADLRSVDAFAAAHLPNTVNIPATSSNFSTYIGWFVDYEQPFYLIAPDAGDYERLLSDLRAIGIDNIAGYTLGENLNITNKGESLPRMSASELAERMKANGLIVLDVRGKTEYEQRHISGARHIPLGYLPKMLDQLPKDHPIVTHCASGYRSQIAASLLRRYGFEDVTNLKDGEAIWSRELATEPN